MSAAKKPADKPAVEVEAHQAHAEVGDTFELAGHGLVSYPDGSVVTANGTFTFRAPGEYRVTYNDDAHQAVEFTVTEPAEDKK